MQTPLKVKGIDPRANSKEPIKPPSPLPYVSRAALKRVRDRLEPPTTCHMCNNPVRLARNRVIYNGQDYGDWPFVYYCTGCDAYVGLHPNTDLPLGTLADRETRKERKKAKANFNRMMHRICYGNRTQAYDLLAREMRIDRRLCHFGFFDQSQAAIAKRILLEMT